MSDDPPDSLIPYDAIVQEALRAVVGRVLGEIVERGSELPGAHHFYITFKTHAAGVSVPLSLRERFPDVELHLIGQLQSNKAEDAAALFDCIHALDRPSLVKALAKAFDKTGRRVPCFVQVDVGDEKQKGGCPVADLPDLLAQAREADIPVRGLMCLPPADIEPAPFFALLGKLAADHGLAELSMGMSGDYETAIMLGATHVRVGTALFGPRD